jgi:hypothetical protein
MSARDLTCLCAALLVACGGGEEHRLPDETGDLTVGGGSAFSAEGTTPGGPDLGGTVWRYVESHCTEGPLDLSGRGFAQQLRVYADDQGLLLVYDQAFQAERCTHTVVQRARPVAGSREFTMTEEVRVAQPPTEECAGRMEQQRPGEVRRNGEFLEVLVQRSMVWCNGFEVRMVYAPVVPEALHPDQIVRHYVAHFNRRDARGVAALFAETGSLVEPFQLTATGGQSRHDGRVQVQAWYDETFAGVDWLALQLSSVQPGRQDGQFVADWQYIDARIDEPFQGRNHFTIAAGEIFESRIELVGEAPEPGTGGGEGVDPEAGDG